MSLYRAQKLIDLACSTTHDEEARTAALAACRLIRKHGLRLTADEPVRPAPRYARRDRWQEAQQAPPVQRRPAPAPPQAQVQEKPPNGGTWASATRYSRCESCGAGIEVGDDAYSVAGSTWCSRH